MHTGAYVPRCFFYFILFLTGELLRDKEWVRQFEAKARSKKSDYRALRRIETRHARKVKKNNKIKTNKNKKIKRALTTMATTPLCRIETRQAR